MNWWGYGVHSCVRNGDGISFLSFLYVFHFIFSSRLRLIIFFSALWLQQKNVKKEGIVYLCINFTVRGVTRWKCFSIFLYSAYKVCGVRRHNRHPRTPLWMENGSRKSLSLGKMLLTKNFDIIMPENVAQDLSIEFLIFSVKSSSLRARRMIFFILKSFKWKISLHFF